MTKHTPGPWLYLPSDEWSHSVATHHGELPDGSPNYWTVASINKNREPEHKANARLIAASPELLEALQSIVECCEESHSARDYASRQTEIRGIARAALAKARGEP